jgi:predicted O-methyltransferase YrrM
MEITHPEIEAYATKHSSPESHLLQQIREETYRERRMPHMCSGPLQGSFLKMISCMIRPAKILEIGTFTGYSAICLAEGLVPEGRLITLEANKELEERLRTYFSSSPFSSQIELIMGEALPLLETLPNDFDLIFVDADKKNYLNYLHACLPKLKTGGYLVFDNMLWYGKILQAEENMDRDTKIIHQVNREISSHPSLVCSLVPLRDGLMMARKSS